MIRAVEEKQGSKIDSRARAWPDFEECVVQWAPAKRGTVVGAE